MSLDDLLVNAPLLVTGDSETGNRITIPHFSLKNARSQNFAFSCWIFPTQAASGFARAIAVKGGSFVLYQRAHDLRITCKIARRGSSDSDQRFFSIKTQQCIPLYKWSHLAIVFSSDNQCMEIYVNDVKEAAVAVAEQRLVCTKSISIGHDMHSNKHVRKRVSQTLVPFEGFIARAILHAQLPLTKLIDMIASSEPRRPLFGGQPLSVISQPLTCMKQLRLWKPDPTVDALHQGATTSITHHISASDHFSIEASNKKSHRVIHCHDMMGGYTAGDRFILHTDSSTFHTYNFHQWRFIDIFIYFSHCRITIPPVGWINAAHKNNVKILGTYITEWEAAEPEVLELLENEALYTEKLVEMARYYNFDGWFFNIECKLPNREYAERMAGFLRRFTDAMHAALPHSLVIWYDSVTSEGELKWQNALNERNKSFFDACDAIFLNYQWNPKLALNSTLLAAERASDVYFGIDIFGRGTYGDGGFGTAEAMRVIRQVGGSTALFAPGWTYENAGGLHSRVKFHRNESRLWTGHRFRELIEDSSAYSNNSLGSYWTVLENGGNGWRVTDDGYNGQKGAVTSYGYCRRCKKIDLQPYLSGSDPAQGTLAILAIEEYYKGTGPRFDDIFYLTVELRDANDTVIDHFSTGELTASDKWQAVSHQFIITDSATRYLYWEDGGKDVEYWAGNFGTVISAASAVLYMQPSRNLSEDGAIRATLDSGECISDYCESRVIVTKLPFITHFCTGIGKHFALDGDIVRSSPWSNQGYQDVVAECMPHDISLYTAISGDTESTVESAAIIAEPYFESAFDAGNSIHLKGVFTLHSPLIEDKALFGAFTLFHTSICIADTPVQIKLFTANTPDCSATASNYSRVALAIHYSSTEHGRSDNVVFAFAVDERTQHTEEHRAVALAYLKNMCNDTVSNSESVSLVYSKKNIEKHGWHEQIFHLDQLCSACIERIDIVCYIEDLSSVIGPPKTALYSLLLGGLHMSDLSQSSLMPQTVENVRYHLSWNVKSLEETEEDEQGNTLSEIVDVHLQWGRTTKDDRAPIAYYNIYSQNNGEDAINFVGRSFNECYRVSAVRVPAILFVQAVGINGVSIPVEDSATLHVPLMQDQPVIN